MSLKNGSFIRNRPLSVNSRERKQGKQKEGGKWIKLLMFWFFQKAATR